MDFVTKEKRSAIMRGVRSGNTRPEKRVRAHLHAMGYRFRLHRRDLPGRPDICLPKHRTVIFVHGCFWHQHKGCKECRTPTSNIPFWETKFRKTMARDRSNTRELVKLGWKVIVVWECQTLDNDSLNSFLTSEMASRITNAPAVKCA